jgi:hypothetical protein
MFRHQAIDEHPALPLTAVAGDIERGEMVCDLDK